MSGAIDERGLENRLARLLWLGTLCGCALIGVGLLLTLSLHTPIGARAAYALMNAGILLLILLPIVRVGVMLTVFLRERERRFATAAAAVLLIIAISLAVGLWTRT
ncbi:MAG TPA: DUF1634 domain-containing protein [Steroidobacteraceae bacterium]|nr:DUF1634 domain-containing protein [Steroidobacteraceae bacterium]